MRIAFCVEGSADRALVHGLRDRWCPDAELLQGRFRGQLFRNQIAKECKILAAKGADLIIFLRDANKENWRYVLRRLLKNSDGLRKGQKDFREANWNVLKPGIGMISMSVVSGWRWEGCASFCPGPR